MIFLMYIENYFFLGPRIIFLAVSRINFLACNALRALQLKKTGSSVSLPRSAFKGNAKAKHCQGKKRKKFSSFLTKSERNQWSVQKWWGFLDRRFNRGDYEVTSRLVPNSNLYWTWDVCLPKWTVPYPILYLEYRTAHAGFRNEDDEYESVPYPELEEEAPDSNPYRRALEAEPDRLEAEDLRGVLVKVDLTNWEIRLIYVMALLAISRICRWIDLLISEY